MEELLQAPVVATIPTLPKRAKLVTIGRHAQRFGDSYALLAAHVMQLRQSEPLVVAITSATKEEGKSITASNLAMALARRGVRVVLADFDLRRPSVARIFDIPITSPGVLQIVHEKLELTKGLQRISLDDDSVPPARPLPTNGQPARQAARQTDRRRLAARAARGWIRDRRALALCLGLPQLITQLAAEADVVVIDTPPALSTAEVADLSRLVDVIFVVARRGKALRRSLRALARQSQSWQSEIGGVIVTDAESDDAYTYYSADQR